MRITVENDYLCVRVGNLEVLALKEVASVGNRFGLTEGLRWPPDSRLSICRSLGELLCCPEQLEILPVSDDKKRDRAVVHAIRAHPFLTRMDTGQDIDIFIPDAMVRDVRVAGSYIPWSAVELPTGWRVDSPPVSHLPSNDIDLIVDYELDRTQLF